ncbi:MAG: hypothetical protein U0667_17195 [Chloroflexota bacterium]
MTPTETSEGARRRLLGELGKGMFMESWECAYLAPGYFQVKAVVATADGLGRVEVQGSGRTADEALDALLAGTKFR